MKIFKEITSDHGYEEWAYASNNMATYVLISAYMHDLYYEYKERYDRFPTSKWFHRHAKFEEVKR